MAMPPAIKGIPISIKAGPATLAAATAPAFAAPVCTTVLDIEPNTLSVITSPPAPGAPAPDKGIA